MNDEALVSKAKRERSPSFPFISLRVAVERMASLDEYFKRHPAPLNKVGLAWTMKPASSQAAQTVAALKSYGLVDYQGTGADLKAALSEDGRNYLRAQQDGIKREILRRCALKPKAIAKYFHEWGAVRPPDVVCLDELVIKAKFSQAGADTFLKVYDATIAFAGLSASDKLAEDGGGEGGKDELPPPSVEVGDFIQWESAGVMQFETPKRVRAIQPHEGYPWVFVDGSTTGIPMSEVTVEQKGSQANAAPPVVPPVLSDPGVSTLRHAVGNEREWLRGPLSKESSYRLLVSGDLGPKEISKLIKLLEAQKAVLLDDEETGQ